MEECRRIQFCVCLGNQREMFMKVNMFKNKKLRLLGLAAAAFVALPVAAYATTTAMHATATFYAAITLTPTDMQFSKVDYSATPSLAGDFVRLGTNNAATYGGVFSAHTGASTAAGTVTVNTGTTGATVDIACSTTGVMADAGTGLISVTGTEVTTGAGGAYGTGSACAGTGTPSTTKVLAGGDVFKLGGQINGSTQAGAWVGGAYDTNSAGGTNISVQVTYQ